MNQGIADDTSEVQDEEGSHRDFGSRSTRNARQGGVSRATRLNEAVFLEKKSDWNKTMDTNISIPEGPEERADEHEANADLVGFT